MKLASNRQITEGVCFVKGHKIEAVIISQIVDPSTKTVFPKYEVMCIQCGLDLEKIRNFRPYFSREELRDRKESKKNVNNSNTKS